MRLRDQLQALFDAVAARELDDLDGLVCAGAQDEVRQTFGDAALAQLAGTGDEPVTEPAPVVASQLGTRSNGNSHPCGGDASYMSSAGRAQG